MVSYATEEAIVGPPLDRNELIETASLPATVDAATIAANCTRQRKSREPELAVDPESGPVPLGNHPARVHTDYIHGLSVWSVPRHGHRAMMVG